MARYTDDMLRELQVASRPLMDFLMKYHNPHVKAIVDSHRVEVVEGLAAEQRVEMDHPSRGIVSVPCSDSVPA